MYTDGGCKGNPGPGGWGVVLLAGTRRRELSGAEPLTTNNRMELRAAIEGLRALNRRCQVTIVTDSEYLKNGITTWIKSWQRNGWQTKERQPVKNADLWRELLDQVARHDVSWRWTKGHAFDVENNRCDALANAAIRALNGTTGSRQ
ncbi:MAG: ribonuclease HI [Thermomicrobiales bacterium]